MANAIQAIINQIITDPDGAVIVEMTFTDGATFKQSKEFRLSNFVLNTFKRIVQAQIDAFSQVSVDVNKVLAIGPFDPTIPPPDPPLAPTAEEQARMDYASNLVLLSRMNRAIATGVKTVNDTDYTTLQKTVKDAFIDSYIDLF